MTTNRPFRLYSYVLRYDDGAAPNPFHGVCTLVICKPRIRLEALEGDWIVGTGSAEHPEDKRGYLIYAMKLTRPKIPMADYHPWAKKCCPGKLPNPASEFLEQRCGDAIYDFSNGRAKLLWSVHSSKDRKRDLSGRYALLSQHFYYFGSKPIRIPEKLRQICHAGSGEQWRPNEKLKTEFIEWLEGSGFRRNVVLAVPLNPPLRRNRTEDQDGCGHGRKSHVTAKSSCDD